MSKKYIVSGLVAGAVLLGCVSFVGAELIITPVDPNAKTQADAQGSASASTSTDSKKMDSTQTQLNGKIDTQIEVNSERVLPTVNKVTDESSARLLPTVNKRTGEAKVTVKGWNPEKKEMVEQKVKAEVEAKEEIQSVEMSEDSVVITYSVPAKFFLFIRTTMPVSVVADANANVHVNFPWYSFLVKSDVSSDVNANAKYVLQRNESDLQFLKSQSSEDRQLNIFLNISAKMHEMSKSIIGNIKA